MRFIPASAGNTIGAAAGVNSTSVHPRVCGEHVSSMLERQRRDGSSPRLRGTHQETMCLRTPDRFIPASAGNTMTPMAHVWNHSVHPRVCGEHCWRSGTLCLNYGSSPRLRGTRKTRGTGKRPDRFIPASAGNTARRASVSVSVPVHPRVCGEHRPHPFGHSRARGSSPRLRGTLEDYPSPIRFSRFIPASAGNTVR